ncbi:DUF72 domain-containing protein [Nocardia pseudobrasiliensis]|uniref:Uncharacterized protein YecE (DUF72 family) n=1 Tax=Nocardia pseudobrasiliensis TaxID=45979 RepID=A0A370HMH2_9NOCA|nr:DUF72 domain-containing protein [Nocardia pseudobrasiliensis]RDI59627.1 uncharacterized protein YecE (DUF72 family) [Nocardia pseudobrasiliensis]
MTLIIGTSGWQYRDWREVLYPAGLPQRLWLEQYAAAFSTVESNNAFYRLPSREVFATWRARTPGDFVVAVKASRFLTHIKRLREPQEPVRRLLEHAAGLGDRLGPVLLQLPPTLRADAGLLDECLGCFPRSVRVAVEPRHESWWTPQIRAVLEAHRAALCWADVRGEAVTPLWRTTEWGYLRLHSGRERPPPRYRREVLARWLARLTETWDGEREVFVYFNNDPGGAAVHDAVVLARLARDAGVTVTRTPELPARSLVEKA